MRLRGRTWPIFLFIPIILSIPSSAQQSEPAAINADAPSMGEAEAAPPEIERQLPKWLEKARISYDEAQKAREEGDEKLAEKLTRAALRHLSRAPREASFFETQDNLGALFESLEAQFAASQAEQEPEGSTGLDVSQQELENAPAVATPPRADKKTYTVPIDPDDPIVKKYIAVYTGHRRGDIQRAIDRMGRYREMVLKTLKEAGLPRELVYLPIVESEYLNTNTSRAGAVGLWQFMPDTARGFGLKVNYWIDERRDPVKATKAAAAYLKQLNQWFDDWHLALAAYNRGEYGVQRDMQFSRSPDFSKLAQRRALPNETEQYVPQFAACVIIADNASSYGFQIVNAKALEMDEVVLGKPIDLKVAADCAGTTEETLRELNPTLRVWCTPKNDPEFALKIPAGTKDRFMAELAKVKDWTPGTGLVKYKVKRGDNLSTIAQKFRTTVSAIQKDNKIKNSRYIHPGQTLQIRSGR